LIPKTLIYLSVEVVIGASSLCSEGRLQHTVMHLLRSSSCVLI